MACPSHLDLLTNDAAVAGCSASLDPGQRVHLDGEVMDPAGQRMTERAFLTSHAAHVLEPCLNDCSLDSSCECPPSCLPSPCEFTGAALI